MDVLAKCNLCMLMVVSFCCCAGPDLGTTGSAGAEGWRSLATA